MTWERMLRLLIGERQAFREAWPVDTYIVSSGVDLMYYSAGNEPEPYELTFQDRMATDWCMVGVSE